MDYKKIAKELKNKLQSMLETAKAENRVFTTEEKTLFDTTAKELDSTLEMIDAENRNRQIVDNFDPAPANTGSSIVVKSNPPKWENFGEFLCTVRKADVDHIVDSRLVDIKNQTGLNEGVGSEGGFLVETDFASGLIHAAYETGALASRVKKIGVSPSSNGLNMNGIAEDSRVGGSRWGGILSYWLHEAGTKTPSMPTFRQIELRLKKLIGLCYATDELLQDSTALGSVINDAFADEFGWRIDDAILRGTGVGMPQGILNSAALVPVAAQPAQAAATVVFENIVNMWSRLWAKSRANSVWFVNQDVEPQLHTMGFVVGVGGVPVYMPAGGVSASPYATLYGRPVVPIEQCSTVGTVGDIVLADLSQYLTIDKGGVQKASSIHVRFVNDEQVFRFVYRMDGQSMWRAPKTPANGTNTLSPFVALATRP